MGMLPAWALLRISLFPEDFTLEGASDEERARFDAALAFATSHLTLSGAVGEDAADALALYAARARDRASPRSLFAAAALALPEGGPLSLADVDVEVAPNRDAQRIEGPPPAAGDLYVAPECVFHSGGVCLYRYNAADGDFDALRLHMPEALVGVLTAYRGGTPAQWASRFAEAGVAGSPGEGITEELIRRGVLVSRAGAVIFNGGERPPAIPLGEAPRAADGARGGPRPNAFATFRSPAALPPALSAAQRVGELLADTSRPAPTRLASVLAEWLDGRWLPLSELERWAGGLVAAAGGRTPPPAEPDQERFLDWVRARALDREIDLAAAPLPRRRYQGEALLLTQWTEDGRLLEPLLFATGAREMMSRYSLPGLPERLAALDDRPPLLLAYHGPGTMGDIARVYAPGARVLEYCGAGSDPSLGLRLTDVEVTSAGGALIYRLREDLTPVHVLSPVPLNEELPRIHPFVRLLLAEGRPRMPVLALVKTALQDFPVRPRLVFEGHVIRRRRAVVPPEMMEGALAGWLEGLEMEGRLGIEGTDGRLEVDPRADDAVRRHLFKELRRGRSVVISELGEPAGVPIDGRRHGAHALIPLAIGGARGDGAPTPPRVPPPRTRREVRGPFATLQLRLLAERAPALLGEAAALLEGERFFYVFVGDGVGSALRLRIPTDRQGLLGQLIGRANGWLDEGAVRAWTLEPYLREWDRYGGAADIDAVEGFFVADAQGLIGGCAGLGAADERRGDLYTLAILQTLTMGPLSWEEAHALCEAGFASFDREFALGSGDRRAIGEGWRARRGAILAAAEGRGDEVIHGALQARGARLGAWLAADPHNGARLRRYARSLLHMSGTRIFFQENRWAEARALFYARHALLAWHHQGIYEGIAASGPLGGGEAAPEGEG